MNRGIDTLRRNARGFSMIEVLVTMAIISLSLLGFAALQAQSLKSNRISLQRSQATILTQDIIERMRANKSAASGGAYEFGINDTPVSGTVAGDDMVAWKADIARALPLGKGGVHVAGDAATITIQWTETTTSSTSHTWSTSTGI
jgi:type IV pilus assembly protein PilV